MAVAGLLALGRPGEPPRAVVAVTARSAPQWPDLMGWQLAAGTATMAGMAKATGGASCAGQQWLTAAGMAMAAGMATMGWIRSR
uniref:Uncharacterized protein n=1 Tax=Oryza barthii TaxID=65489 RepID=A0A0D3F6B5_9ORYZ